MSRDNASASKPWFAATRTVVPAILISALFAQSAALCADDPPETVPPPSKTVPAQVPELLKEAAAAAREIGETGPAAYALLEIAVVMADSDKAGAAALVEEALKLFPRVKASGNVDKPTVANLAAALQTRLGDFEGARRTVELLRDDEERDEARMKVLDELLALQEYDRALELCGEFAEEGSRDEAYAAVAASLAGAGRLDEARSVIKKIERESEQAYAWVLMVEARVAADDIPGAQRLIESIDEPAARFNALAAIVEAQVDAGDMAAAKKTFLKAQKVAGEASVDEGLRLIELQAEVGQVREAVTIADSLGDQQVRDEVVRGIVIRLAAQGETKEAERLIETIESDDAPTVPLIAAIAVAQAHAGEIDESFKTARKIESDPHALGALLVRLAAIQVEKKDAEAARKTLNVALKAADKIDVSEFWKDGTPPDVAMAQTWAVVDLLLDIAATRAAAGDRDGARQVFAQVRKMTEAYEKKTYFRASLVGEIAKVESHNGLAGEAIEWSRALQAPALRESALLGVAEGLLAAADDEASGEN